MKQLNKLKAEITAHPTERKGFDEIDFERMSAAEKNEAKKLFLDELGEGNEWLSPQAKKFFGASFASELENRLSRLDPGDHGYIFIPYFLYLETNSDTHLEKMKTGIIQGDARWDMRRSALGRNLKKLLPSRQYAEFCKNILLNEKNISVIKTALLGIQCHVQGKSEFSLNHEFERTLELLASTDAQKRHAGESKIQSIQI